MRERAKAIGADLSVTSQLDVGSELFVRWMVPTEQERGAS
jgi:hypothetical protein